MKSEIFELIKDIVKDDKPLLNGLETKSSEELIQDLLIYHAELKAQNEELELQQSELQSMMMRNEVLYMDAPVGYVVLDENFKIVQANKKAISTFDFLGNRIKGSPISLLFAKKQITNFLDWIKKDSKSSLEILLRGKDETFRWYILTLQQWPDNEHWYMITLTDIDDQKNLQLQLDHQNEQLESMFNNSSDGIAIIGLDYYFQRANQAYIDILNIPLDQLKKTTCVELSVPKDRERSEQILKQVLSDGKVENFEKVCQRGDGSTVNINMSAVLLPDKKRILLNIHNITNEVELRDSLTYAREKAERASNAKSSFLANMSHEIRTPMTGILGFVEQLQKGETSPERIAHFETIKNSGETLLNIINDILDFSKIESNKIEIELSCINIKNLIENSVDIFRAIASVKDINVSSVMDDHIPEGIFGDETRLKQVLNNLMNNAIKFTQSGGNIILETQYNRSDELIQIAMIDTGIGISSENIATIFESFSQGDASTTRRYGGTGLGLTISSRLVTLMSGELKVESKVGEGSKFYFELPVKKCSINDEIDERSLESKVTSLNGHVLIVEDNKTNQMLMSMILDDLNITYDIANDGAEAVIQNKITNYDLILMDENMPVMNGIEATTIIRENEKDEKLQHTPIIAVTANALVKDRDRFLEAGMDDYIAKPYTEEDILRVLKKYLG
jgi:PAS domain S-box-containing protein